MLDHTCKRAELIWDTEPDSEGECIVFNGKCPKCGKLWQQVFTETDNLWDVEAEEYGYI